MNPIGIIVSGRGIAMVVMATGQGPQIWELTSYYGGSVVPRYYITDIRQTAQMSTFQKLHFTHENAIYEKEVRPKFLSSEVMEAVSSHINGHITNNRHCWYSTLPVRRSCTI